MEQRDVSSSSLRLQGHFLCKAERKTLEVWLEEDGFFRLKFEEWEEGGGSAQNEECGMYHSNPQTKTGGEVVHFELAAAERQWKWKDANDGDSGVDATDLKYPAVLNNDELSVRYLEAEYKCKKM